jgi:hypothetical protein
MNEADSSVQPEVKTRFDILFVKILKLYSFFLNCDMRFINLTRKIARWTFSSVRGSNEPSNPIRIKKIQSRLIINHMLYITSKRRRYQKCRALKTGVCWFEAATYKKE